MRFLAPSFFNAIMKHGYHDFWIFIGIRRHNNFFAVSKNMIPNTAKYFYPRYLRPTNCTATNKTWL